LVTHPVVGPLAQRLGVSPHAVVLAWVVSRSPSVLAIPSARTVDHALDSISAADLTLSPADLAAIDAAEFSRA
jgi:aryl-alcohol dehydrogenase-like predicted oxidoreductase